MEMTITTRSGKPWRVIAEGYGPVEDFTLYCYTRKARKLIPIDLYRYDEACEEYIVLTWYERQ